VCVCVWGGGCVCVRMRPHGRWGRVLGRRGNVTLLIIPPSRTVRVWKANDRATIEIAQTSHHV
jgi:hypothetical protein